MVEPRAAVWKAKSLEAEQVADGPFQSPGRRMEAADGTIAAIGAAESRDRDRAPAAQRHVDLGRLAP
jgi:hypothetical protein